jgi:hypothetical protein
MQGNVIIEDVDDTIEITGGSSLPNFKIPLRPSPPNGVAGPSLGTDLLINRRKVNSEIMSMSSGSHPPSEYSDETSESERQVNRGGGRKVRVDAEEEEYETEESSEGGDDTLGNRFKNERSRLEKEMQEKKEILYQMDRLEAKGFRLPRKFNMQSDIEEMRAEFQRIVREKEIDASIRFQRKMMMALVTGVEFMNTRFDPFDVKLDGWSEQVHENVTDYDDIFEELHEKYKSSGKKMAPELRLLLSLSGSAFMFHLTNSMFKQSKLPDVEEVIRSNPDLMKSFQAAAQQQMNSANRAAAAMSSQPAARGPGGNLFSMVGSLFNGPRPSAPQPPQTPQPMQPTRPTRDIDTIINNVHADINVNRVETMSVTDDEITSIIEDTADMNGILMNGSSIGGSPGRGAKGKPRQGRKIQTRTLNL